MDDQAAWDKAKAHFDAVRKVYQDLEGTAGVNTKAIVGILAAAPIEPKQRT